MRNPRCNFIGDPDLRVLSIVNLNENHNTGLYLLADTDPHCTGRGIKKILVPLIADVMLTLATSFVPAQ